MEESAAKKEKTFYKKWWFWVIILIIIAICILIIRKNSNTTMKEIDKISTEIKDIDDKATLYTLEEENAIILRIPNYSEVSVAELNQMKEIIKNKSKTKLSNYSKFIMISDLEDYDNNVTSVAVYNLPDMKFDTNLSKSYIDNSNLLENENNKRNVVDNNISESNLNQEKGKDIILTLGTYEVGTDIKAGKYDLIAQSGRGNVITKGSIYESIMLSVNETEYYSMKYNNLILENGDIVEIINNLTVLFQAK